MSKQNYHYCPLCSTRLETRDVAPCAECGHLAEEIEHALSGQHTYAEMRMFGDMSVILCDFCQVDFGSFAPEYFGLPANARIGYQHMQILRTVSDISIRKDKFCPQCHRRLAFLKFVAAVRELHGKNV